MVDYVKDNFLAGRTFAGIDDLNARVMHWLTTVANVRVHGTTAERPVDRWPAEALTDHDAIVPYRIDEQSLRKASWEGFVRFDGSRYSVPPEVAGKEVVVGRRAERIIIRCGEMIVADHAAARRRGSTIADEQHIAAMWKLTLGKTESELRDRWNVRFDAPVATTPLSTFEVLA